METKKAKVVASSYKTSGTGQHGQYHVHMIVFDNGDNGDYISKDNPQTKFVIGQEVEYTKEVTTTSKNGNTYTNTKIKPVQAGGGFGFNGNPAVTNKRTALQCAVTLASTKAIPLDEVKKYAEMYTAWLNGENKPEQKQDQKPETTPAHVPDDDSGLPF